MRVTAHTVNYVCGGLCAGNRLQAYRERYTMRYNSRSRPDKARKRVIKCLLRIGDTSIQTESSNDKIYEGADNRE